MENAQELIKALVKTQLEITPPIKDKETKTSRFTFRYCSLDAIYQACRVPLATNGLTLSHTVEQVESRHYLLTTIYHISGETMCNRLPMFVDQNTSQGFASGLTYARRYAICALLGLPTEDDDDGQLSEDEQKESHPNPDLLIKEINALIGENKELYKSILHGYKVDRLSSIVTSELVKTHKSLLNRRGAA